MSISHRPFRLLGGLASAAACLAASAAPATAANSLRVTAQCTFPVVGTQPVAFTATFPDGLQAGDWAAPVVVSDFDAAAAETGIAAFVEFGRNKSTVEMQIEGASPGGPVPPAGPFSAPVFLTDALPDPAPTYGFTLQYPTARTVNAEITGLKLNLRAVSEGGSIRIFWSPNDSDGNPETFDAPCVLDAGQQLTASFDVATRTRPLDTVAPSAPGAVSVSGRTERSATLAWGAATDDVGVDHYRVLVRETATGISVGSGRQTADLTTTFRQLKPATQYTVEVAALDRGFNVSAAATTTFTTVTPRENEPFALDLAGSATLQGRTRGTIPLSGLLEGTLYTDDTVGAGLTLAPTTVDLRPQGALRVTAKATFSTPDAPTASFVNGVFKVRSAVDVKFSEAKLFGTVPVSSGANCGLRDLAVLDLTSGAGFSLSTGGTLAGTATLGRLANCGTFGTLVGPDLGTAAVSIAAQ